MSDKIDKEIYPYVSQWLRSRLRYSGNICVCVNA